MKRPFFSILLPTKNRAEIVGGAIESALKQTYPYFELVVSDNDDSATATAEAVSAYKDERIQYLRTPGNLAMHENWDNALIHAKGDHVLILEDKTRLVPNALEILHHHLQKQGQVPISYNLQFARGNSIRAPKHYPRARWFSSEAVVEEFCRFSPLAFNLFPKGLDSCAPRELLWRIKEKSPTGLAFSHISPDYASGFMLLSETPRILYLDAPLVFIPNNWMWQGKYSNGQSNYTKDPQIKRFMRQLPVTREEILQRVPIKTEWLWINSVIFDFDTKYRRPGHHPEIDWIRYHAFCIICILIGKRVGGDLSVEVAETRKSLAQKSPLFRLRVGLNLLRRLAGYGVQMARGFLNSDR